MYQINYYSLSKNGTTAFFTLLKTDEFHILIIYRYSSRAGSYARCIFKDTTKDTKKDTTKQNYKVT